MKYCDRIILASASPRRKEILGDMGLTFEVIPGDVDESCVHIKNPVALTKRLSALKANAVNADGATVIAADTVVVFRGRIYGKPHTKERAVEMLSVLSGHWHTVCTGVTVKQGERSVTFAVKSYVKFKRLTEEDILSYVEETNPVDKAGAYGIQDGRVVQKYSGSYSNIVGLPKEKLAKTLARMGVNNGYNRTFH